MVLVMLLVVMCSAREKFSLYYETKDGISIDILKNDVSFDGLGYIGSGSIAMNGSIAVYTMSVTIENLDTHVQKRLSTYSHSVVDGYFRVGDLISRRMIIRMLKTKGKFEITICGAKCKSFIINVE